MTPKRWEVGQISVSATGGGPKGDKPNIDGLGGHNPQKAVETAPSQKDDKISRYAGESYVNIMVMPVGFP